MRTARRTPCAGSRTQTGSARTATRLHGRWSVSTGHAGLDEAARYAPRRCAPLRVEGPRRRRQQARGFRPVNQAHPEPGQPPTCKQRHAQERDQRADGGKRERNKQVEAAVAAQLHAVAGAADRKAHVARALRNAAAVAESLDDWGQRRPAAVFGCLGVVGGRKERGGGAWWDPACQPRIPAQPGPLRLRCGRMGCRAQACRSAASPWRTGSTPATRRGGASASAVAA